MDLTTLPTTSQYSGAMPYHEEDDRVTLFAQDGVHDHLSVERAIWWIHRELDGKPVTVQWRMGQKQNQDGNQKRTPPDGGQEVGGVPGTSAEEIPPSERPKLDEQLPPV